jgi:hypothetical protein
VGVRRMGSNRMVEVAVRAEEVENITVDRR